MARSAPFRRTLREELRHPAFAREYHAELQRLRLARQLAAARETAGLTQGELARRMGTSQPAVARLERGDYGGYRVGTLVKAAHALGRRLSITLESRSRTGFYASAKRADFRVTGKRAAQKKR